jgi:uncharacterized membrane protein YfcA
MFTRGLLTVLAAFAITFLGILLATLGRDLRDQKRLPSFASLATGFVTNCLDTLGIGSFATTTSVFKFFGIVPDELIPGTLFVGHTLPVIFQAFIYISIIKVDAATLIAMIAAATAGGWCGAGMVARLPQRALQIAMGIGLLAAAGVLLASQLHLFPIGGNATQLRGWPLVIGVLGNFSFGAFSTLGIGLYAPCMTIVSLLGMSPAAAFPIMMGSGAFLMPVASIQFIRKRAFMAPVALGLLIGGLIGVPIAAFVVKSLPLTALRYLAIAVALYAAQLMLLRNRASYRFDKRPH